MSYIIKFYTAQVFSMTPNKDNDIDPWMQSVSIPLKSIDNEPTIANCKKFIEKISKKENVEMVSTLSGKVIVDVNNIYKIDITESHYEFDGTEEEYNKVKDDDINPPLIKSIKWIYETKKYDAKDSSWFTSLIKTEDDKFIEELTEEL